MRLTTSHRMPRSLSGRWLNSISMLRFILACNYPSKLIDPLRSRLQEYVFNYPQDSKTIKNHSSRDCLISWHKKRSRLEVDLPTIESLVTLYYPNWRKVLHQLQRCCASGVIDREVVSKVREEHISTLFELMKAKNFTKVREWVAESMASGLESTDIVNTIYTEMKEYLVPKSLPQCVLTLADYQHRASVVANQEINTEYVCGDHDVCRVQV